MTAKKKGPTAGTAEPKTRPSRGVYDIKRDYGKQPDCVFWPDAKPTKDLTGQESGRLTLIHPVYAYRRAESSGRVWYWLAECSCKEKNEVILCNTTQTKSCGCLRTEATQRRAARLKAERAAAIKHGPVYRMPPKPMKFNRLAICTRRDGIWLCEHYHRCQDERIETGRPSSIYGPDCYTETKEQVNYESTLGRTLR